MANETLADLNSELTADPAGLGYPAIEADASLSDDQKNHQMADLLNKPDRQFERDETVLMSEIETGLDWEEVKAVLQGGGYKAEALALYTGFATIELTSQNFRLFITDVFGTNSKTRANMVAMFQRVGSRAEELGWSEATPSVVGKARAL